MISRRDVMKWGAIAPALVGGSSRVMAKVPDGLDALVVDSRHAPGILANPGSTRVLGFDGDVTQLWFETLDPLWRKPGFVLGGITGRDALFVLETLAWDRGRRVVSRKDLPSRSGRKDGPVSWVIAPVHPSVKKG
ncbi:MAG TPA: hypothetical protein VL094_05730 [Sphingomonadaceae bacterium]|nr:hypothetical protein [Sphingomonadaceae bacterium]